MKTIFYIVLGLLLAWSGYMLGEGDTQKWTLAAVIAVEFAIAGALSAAFKDVDSRLKVNINLIVNLSLGVCTALNLIFSFFAFSVPALVIPNAVLTLIMVAASYGVAKS